MWITSHILSCVVYPNYLRKLGFIQWVTLIIVKSVVVWYLWYAFLYTLCVFHRTRKDRNTLHWIRTFVHWNTINAYYYSDISSLTEHRFWVTDVINLLFNFWTFYQVSAYLVGYPVERTFSLLASPQGIPDSQLHR